MTKPVIRMSSAGKCPRALSAEMLGYEARPEPEWLGRAADEGKWHEDRIVKLLELGGTEVTVRQGEYKLDYPLFVLLGHIDGMTTENHDYDNQRLLEIKTMSQYEFDRWMKGRFEAFPNYAAQVTCYMTATGLTSCRYIVKNRNTGYIDDRVLDTAPVLMGDIKRNLNEVIKAAGQNQLVDRQFDLQSIECRRCSYQKLCIPEPEALTPFQQIELDVAAAQWRRGKELSDEGQRLLDEAKETFAVHARATGIPKWQHAMLAVHLVHTRRESYEKKALLEIFTPEQLAPALKVTEYDQLRINDLQKENDNA